MLINVRMCHSSVCMKLKIHKIKKRNLKSVPPLGYIAKFRIFIDTELDRNNKYMQLNV
jgi:hypothetical protein